MQRKITQTALLIGMVAVLTQPIFAVENETVEDTPIVTEVKEVQVIEPKVINKPIEVISETVVKADEVEEEYLSEDEIELIALVTMAEAEGECEEGKRLVIDTILNRVDHERFPDTVEGVIYQRNQFTSMWNGRVNRCYVREDICQLVREELESRTNYDVMFFTAGNYGKYGVPMFQVENHYFASYD